MTLRTHGVRAAGVVAGLCVLLALAGADPRTLWTLPLVTLVFLGLHRHARGPSPGRTAFVAFLVATSIVFGAFIAQAIAANLRVIPEWDFLGFWIHARTATLGQDFYDPASAHAVAARYASSAPLTPEFTREILDTGFWYPAPSMLLFWPLGLIDPRSALPLWYAFHGAILAIDVVLLGRLFFPAGGAVAALACAALLGICYGTESTFRYAQTNLVALLALLLFWRRRDATAGGAWVAVAYFVKPLLAMVVVERLVAARGRVVAGALLCALALWLTSAAAFGPATVADSLTRARAAAKPGWIYDEPTNQSLLGLVLRWTHTPCTDGRCVANPLFIAGAVAMAAITTGIGWRLQRAAEDEWALSLYLLLALIVYPVSQLFYSVLLIPPALVAWRHRERVLGGAWTVAIVLATVYALAALHDGEATGFAYLLLWGALALVGTRLACGGGWPLRATAAADAGAAGGVA